MNWIVTVVNAGVLCILAYVFIKLALIMSYRIDKDIDDSIAETTKAISTLVRVDGPIREIGWKCRYCGSMNLEPDRKCPSCYAPRN